VFGHFLMVICRDFFWAGFRWWEGRFYRGEFDFHSVFGWCFAGGKCIFVVVNVVPGCMFLGG
jgi:hypothetical protein